MTRAKKPLVAAAVLALVVLSAQSATGDPRDAGREGGNTGDVIWSEVNVTSTGPGGESVPLSSHDATWVPPACWMQPLHTPEEFAKMMADATAHPESAQSDWLAEIREADYYQGEDGHWWGLVYNQHLPEEEARDKCELFGGNPEWIETGDLPEQTPITPELLAEIAYAATELPAPEVRLSPPPELQKVNLDVHAAIDGNGLPERVSTTASIDFAGMNIAATVVAAPAQLRIEAGTEHAEPGVCTYQLSGSTVDTAGSGCNIVYRKTSGDGTYPLEAQVTWNVHWTASADPDGPVEAELPTGYTTTPYDVTVREIQTIVR
jgi:hypothetical protein